MKTANYARQSIEKQDSVSIDAQLEKCELICRLHNWEFQCYSDAGYSGSTIKRPAFEQLINDIKQGKINRVISYRLDRISRSITDFANLLQLFEKYNVQYISATENFDTTTPLGRAMVYIVMVFAQLERETIAQRITDNYYFRAKQGLFMGGNCPLGYHSMKIQRNGKKTSVLEIDPISSEIVKKIYNLFVCENFNANKIALYLNEKGIKTQKDSTWSRNKVIRILQNPAYVTNTPDIYGFFVKRGFNIIQTPEEFNGTRGICVYGKEKGKGPYRKTALPSEQTVTIGDFPPLIDSDIWLAAQHKLLSKGSPSSKGTVKSTWLSGLLMCSSCKGRMSTRISVKSGRKYSYFCCCNRSGRGKSTCPNKVYYTASMIENIIRDSIIGKISTPAFAEELSKLDIPSDNDLIIKKTSLLSKIYSIENEINSYIQQIGMGSIVVDSYLNQKITELDKEKKLYEKEIEDLRSKNNAEKKPLSLFYNVSASSDKMTAAFNAADLQTKNMLATALINRIFLDENRNIAIEWFL